MPPSSRGLHFQHFVRHFHVTTPCRRGTLRAAGYAKKPRYKSSPIPGRATPRSEYDPNSSAKEHDASLEPPRFSIFARFRDRIPYGYRRGIARVLIFGPIAMLVWMHFPLEVVWASGGSMSPFLNPNSADLPETQDKLLIHRLSFPDRSAVQKKSPQYHPERGDVVVYYSPRDPEKIIVKRVVGIPGDRVQPLPGYSGGDEPVLVGFNHIWVEGDVDNRDKSLDSNWHGPISQNLVIGKVIALLEPWYRPAYVNPEDHTYPAKAKGRVQEGAVQAAELDPRMMETHKAFLDGIAKRELDTLKAKRLIIPQTFNIEDRRVRAVQLYKITMDEIAKNHPSSIEVALELKDELELAFTRSGLTSTGQIRKGAPAMRKGMDREGEDEDEGPAKKALREYLERTRKERDEQQALEQEKTGCLTEAEQAKETAEREAFTKEH